MTLPRTPVNKGMKKGWEVHLPPSLTVIANEVGTPQRGYA